MQPSACLSVQLFQDAILDGCDNWPPSCMPFRALPWRSADSAQTQAPLPGLFIYRNSFLMDRIRIPACKMAQ